jgi:hypothetical protein
MASQKDQTAIEERVDAVIDALHKEFDGVPALRWAVARALIHRGVHHAVDGKGPPPVDFCALATYLADMVGHAHRLAHGDNPQAQSHKDQVH